MARLNLGKVLVTLEGEWDGTRAYEKYCEVTNGGSSYVSKKAVPIGTPITDTAFWQLRASKGADGTDGTNGNDGLDAYQPFKGWYSSTSELNTSFGTPQVGDYAYIKGATANDPVAIYQCVTAGSWTDSGRTFNPSNNQEFASGQSLNTVNIVDNLTSSSATDVLSAKQGKELKGQIDALGPKIGQYSDSLTESASSMIYTSILNGVSIKQGQSFRFKITGTHSGDRMLLRENGTSGSNVQDFVTIGTTYTKTASADITRFMLYHNGDIDIEISLDINMSLDIATVKDGLTNLNSELDASNDKINENTAYIENQIPQLNEEVFAISEFVFNSSAPNPTEIRKDFILDQGQIGHLKITNIGSGSCTFNSYIENENGNIVETLYSAQSIASGATLSTDFSSGDSHVKVIRFTVSVRGVLKIVATNNERALGRLFDNKINAVGNKVGNIEDVLHGTSSSAFSASETLDTTEDISTSFEVNVEKYDILKLTVISCHDLKGRSYRWWYRKTSVSSATFINTTDAPVVVTNGGTNTIYFEAPESMEVLGISQYSGQRGVVDLKVEQNPIDIDNVAEIARSTNVLDVATLTNRMTLNPNGTIGTDSTYSCTDFIAVKEGDVVVFANDVVTLTMPNTDGRPLSPRPQNMRLIAVYDINKNLLTDLAPDSSVNHTRWTVPKGVHYLRITAKTAIFEGTNARINLGGVILPYEPYWVGNRPTGVIANRDRINGILNFPCSHLPEYIINTLAYKPLGQLSKGYLCVTDDDGTIGLGTYTLPMVIAKDVPMTFMVMKESAIFQEGNEEYAELLMDAIANHGCSIGQHGGVNWTDYNEKQLYEYFLQQKAFWDSIGVKVGSAGCPSAFCTPMINLVSGGFFGCHRAAYEGLNTDNTPNYMTIHTDNFASIPRSNVYCLASLNVRDKSLVEWQAVIDWAAENKVLLNVYFHDFDFVEGATDYQARRALLEGFLDYAKAHITMVRLEDVPRLV